MPTYKTGILISQAFTTYDYGKMINWTGVIETFDETGTINLGGVIRYDENTLVRATFTRNAAFRDAGYFWSVTRIEESKENGKDIYELGTVKSSIENNLLIPITGETLLKMVVDPTAKTVVTECLIDFTKLDKNKFYKISARVDDGLNAIRESMVRLTEAGDVRLTEIYEIRIIN